MCDLKERCSEEAFRRFTEQGESPFLDYKIEFYDLDSDLKKGEFAKDMIAFANTARRTARPCFIIFGIADDQINRPGLERRQFNRSKSIKSIVEDCFHKRCLDICEAWIKPLITKTQMWHVEIDEHIFLVLKILPEYPSEPYCLKKSYGESFPVGTVFIRKGSSCVKVETEAKEYLLSRSKVAYLERSDWQNIIDSHKTGEFLKMHELEPFIEPTLEKPQKENALEFLKKTLQEGKKYILVIGERGEGKTVLLYRLAYFLADSHNSDLITSRSEFGEAENGDQGSIVSVKNELEVVPPLPIPVHVNLRTTFSSSIEIENCILNNISINRQLLPDPQTLGALFDIPNSKWTLILDGIDELRNLKESGPVLSAWLKGLPDNVQVVLSSRPYAISGIEAFERIELGHLKPEHVQDYLQLNLYKAIEQGIIPDNEFEEKKKSLEDWLNRNNSIIPFLSNFRALGAFAQIDMGGGVSPKPDIDYILPSIEKSPEYGKSQTINDEVPIISEKDVISEIIEEQLDSQVPISMSESITDISSDEDLPLSLGRVMLSVINFIETDEIHRSTDIGTDSKREAETARRKIAKTAWDKPWEIEEFVINDCVCLELLDDESLVWNTNIGFLRTKKITFTFMTSLLHYFFIAEYASDHMEHKQTEIRNKLIEYESKSDLFNQIQQLINDLCGQEISNA